MKKGSFTIRKLFDMHRAECPDSQISEKAIRAAVKSGALPCIYQGNRALVSAEKFELWRQGDLNREH